MAGCCAFFMLVVVPRPSVWTAGVSRQMAHTALLLVPRPDPHAPPALMPSPHAPPAAQVLFFDSTNIEAIACLASQHFYTDQPEIALRYYRRLLQMGVNNAELWANLGLCCFYSSQYDMCLGCFDQALQLADDSALGDIWYNVGQVAIGIGDPALAYQCLKIAVSVCPSHAESYNNLGVLEYRKGNDDQARSFFRYIQEGFGGG